MSDATKVEMGVCSVTFDSVDLGYTAGGVKCSYSAETKEIEVDQEDAPIGERVTKQSFEVVIPLAEYDLERLASLLPGATYVEDSVDDTKFKLTLSGSAGIDLLDMAKELVITPADSTNDSDKITLFYAVPTPNLEFAFEKENVRVYEITFKAMKGTNGFVLFGDATASA